MPLYDLECKSCKEVSEHSIPLRFIDIDCTEFLELKCPKCGTQLTPKDRIISIGGFILKGSGWFKDGYQREANVSEQNTGTKSEKK